MTTKKTAQTAAAPAEKPYRKTKSGVWVITPPGCPSEVNLSLHKVTEHTDGTISVDGRIVVSMVGYSWRGHLVKGKFNRA